MVDFNKHFFVSVYKDDKIYWVRDWIRGRKRAKGRITGKGFEG